jgi:hypothetical protein
MPAINIRTPPEVRFTASGFLFASSIVETRSLSEIQT